MKRWDASIPALLPLAPSTLKSVHRALTDEERDFRNAKSGSKPNTR
jgi:hypothetical protein